MKKQKATHNKKRNFVWLLTILMSIGLLASVASAETTWYVKANADAGGDGSEGQPFNSLQAVEQKSEPGDTIIVLACPADIPALDEGIALKDGQKLLGSDADVTLDDPVAAQAKITNSNANRYSGDAIVLANDNEVTNISIADAHRSGISGHNISGASIHQNFITDHNQGRQTFKFIYYNCNVEYYGIHLTADADNAMGDLLVHDNVVRDARGGGVMVYLGDSASAEILLDGNTFTDLSSTSKGVNEAIVIGTTDSARANSIVRDTFVDNIGRGSPICDGTLFYMEGDSQQDVLVQGYTSRNTKNVGGDRSFGMIAWTIPTSDNAKLNFRLKDSELRGMNGFTGVYLYVEGKNGNITGHVENTVVENSGGRGIYICNFHPGNSYEIHLEGNQVTDCPKDGIVFWNSSGSIKNVNISLKDNTVRDCSWNGLRFGNSSVIENVNISFEDNTVRDCLADGIQFCNYSGSIKNAEISLQGNTATDCLGHGFQFVNWSSIENVEISLKDNAFLGNQLGGCHLRTSWTEEGEDFGGPIGDFSVMMEGNDLVGGDYGVYFLDEKGLTASSIIDLGGGGLGSAGRNRIVDNANAVESWNYDVVAKNNWWGSPEGPSSSLLEEDATFDFEPFLTADPHLSTSVEPNPSLKTTTWGRLKKH